MAVLKKPMRDNAHIVVRLSSFLACALWLTSSLSPQQNPVEQATEYNDKAVALAQEGRYDEALPIAEQAVQLTQSTFGPNHTNTAQAMDNLGSILLETGDYARSEILYKSALSIRRKVLGAENPATVQSLKNLARLYEHNGNFTAAEAFRKETLAIVEHKSGSNSLETADALNHLAELYREKGDYDRAESLHKRALSIRRKTLPKNSPAIATSLNNLSLLYRAKADYVTALTYAEQALDIDRAALGMKSTDTLTDLNNLAELYRDMEDYETAEPIYRGALEIADEALGPDAAITLTLRGNLGELYVQKGDLGRAAPLIEQVYDSRKRTLGSDSPQTIASLSDYADLLRARKEYAASEKLLTEASAYFEKTYGPDHPRTIAVVSNLAVIHWASGQPGKSLSEFSRELESEQKNTANILQVSSELQKRASLIRLSGSTDSLITFALESKSPQPAASNLAFRAVFERKGLALEALLGETSFMHLGRVSAPVRQRIETLEAKRSQLATMVLSGPGETQRDVFNRKVLELEKEAEGLKAEISKNSLEFRAQSQDVSVQALQAALPVGAILVEFVRYRRFLPDEVQNAWAEDRYAAFIVGSKGHPILKDIAKAEEVDLLCQQFRYALGSPSNGPETQEIARKLDHLVMESLRSFFGNATMILVSPDSELNLIPFGALVDENGKYLITRFQLSYLTAGRDVLRLQVELPSRQEPVVFANPLYGLDRVTANSACHFSPLAATAKEATDIAQLLPTSQTFIGVKATKSALQHVSGPRILHVATHAFYDDSGQCITQSMDPMLRSGVALAGSNRGKAGRHNGILTALELADLDLWGTQLVTLSACDTGVGEAPAGEGVFGLRRALTLAGSRAQLISLWMVDDEQTRLFMKNFYQRLLKGDTRAQALTSVQRDMLHDHLDPYYWAAFILSGAWGPPANK